MKILPKIQFITSPSKFYSIEEQVEKACSAGIKFIQLRLKNTEENNFIKTALKIKEICRKFSSLLIINDNVKIAQIIEADGVHLGKTDMHPSQARIMLGSKAIIGATADNFEYIKQIADFPIDYIGLGPFAFTQTKENISEILGFSGYSEILNKCASENIDIPIYAIGGIKTVNIEQLMKTGIHGIAISSLISNSQNIEKTVNEINTLNPQVKG